MSNEKPESINLSNISETIYIIRGSKVMFDFDLAGLYGIPNKALKQQVRRNLDRFPEDFMIELTRDEWNEQVTNCDLLKKYKSIKSPPFAFTEQGVAMLSSVLKSKRAVQINISIMRAFVEIRKSIGRNKNLEKKLKEVEKNLNLKFLQYDEQFKVIMEVIQEMHNEDNEIIKERLDSTQIINRNERKLIYVELRYFLI